MSDSSEYQHQVLARKWRPSSFSELVGQEHVMQALSNGLERQRLHHAYLLTGTRGVGKTTIARILAKCLNCEEGVSANPCGKCSSCVEIADGRSIDLLEIDAASRTKVEDMRELLDNVQYAPSHSRYKVYLIDEVHMLSNSSFNALLKTLEEPPAHAIFIFATTHPQKMPATVLSRCLQFNLKNLTQERIVEHIKFICAEENLSYEEGALWRIAKSANGSMRDALSICEQAISFGNGAIQTADVDQMLGAIDELSLLALLGLIADGDAAKALAGVEKLLVGTNDHIHFINSLLSLIHQIAVAQLVPNSTRPDDIGKEVQALAERVDAVDVQLYYQALLAGKRDFEYAADAKSGIEIIILRMLAFARMSEEVDMAQVRVGVEEPSVEKSQSVSNKGESIDSTVQPSLQQTSSAPQLTEVSGSSEDSTANTVGQKAQMLSEPQIDQRQAPQEKVAVAKAEPIDEPVVESTNSEFELKGLPDNDYWLSVFSSLPLTGVVRSVASHCILSESEEHKGGYQLQFSLLSENAMLYKDEHAKKLQQALAMIIPLPIAVRISVVESFNVALLTPNEHKKNRDDQRQQEAVESILNDPNVQTLVEEFNGEIDMNSIKPV